VWSSERAEYVTGFSFNTTARSQQQQSSRVLFRYSLGSANWWLSRRQEFRLW